jgi:tetratricopeptide (TPR) repeat protein
MSLGNRGNYPRLRSNTSRKPVSISSLSRPRGSISSLSAYSRRRGNFQVLAWSAITASLGLLILVITGPLWLPAVLRLIPDRYIAAYAPESIREMVFQVDPLAQVPTTSPDQDAANLLIEQLSPTDTPTPLPTIPPTGGGGYIQPTPLAVEPTATVTPAFIPPAGNRAADGTGNANLAQASALLTGFTHTYQGWNNCAPATVTTTLSYWGIQSTQAEAAAFLKPNPEDRNVRPDELQAYAESLGLQMEVRVNGNIELIKQFILAGYPVMIEKGFDPEPDRLGWMGHYLVLIGFSDAERAFVAMDSYLGPNRSYPYDDLDRFWRQFNRVYMIIHRPDQAVAVASLIGENMDDNTMYTNALYMAQFELNLNRNDAFGWFNLGSNLVALGRYEEAATAFDEARNLGLPWRILWYQFGPYEAYLHVGRYEDVLTLADATLADNPYSEEAYYYKGLVYAARGQTDAARRQFTQALRFNAHYEEAQMQLDLLGNN